MTAVWKVKQLSEAQTCNAGTPFAVWLLWPHRLQRAKHSLHRLGWVSSDSCRPVHLADDADKYILIKLPHYEDSNEHFHVGVISSEDQGDALSSLQCHPSLFAIFKRTLFEISPETRNRDVGANIILDGWKTRISTQAAGHGLFIYDCVFINIYRLSYKCAQFFSFIWSRHGSLWRFQREPGTYWICYHKYEVDVSIQEIRAWRPAALLSLRDALNRHSCRRRSLINRRIKMKAQKEDGAWKTTGMRPPGCPTDPHPLPHLPTFR